MALKISAEAVRALIPDGVYSLQLLEQRDGQRIVLTFSLASRSGGHTIQIETSEEKVVHLFRHLLPDPSLASQGAPRSRPPSPRRTRAEAPREQRSTATPPVTESPPVGTRPKRQRRQPR